MIQAIARRRWAEFANRMFILAGDGHSLELNQVSRGWMGCGKFVRQCCAWRRMKAKTRTNSRACGNGEDEVKAGVRFISKSGRRTSV